MSGDRVIRVTDLVGTREIGARAGVSPQAVTNWQSRRVDFPRPLVRLRQGPVFDWTEVEAWLRTTDRYMRRARPGRKARHGLGGGR